MNKKTIKDVDVKGKKCLVRVALNVPMKTAVITDENRINVALPPIKYLMDHGVKVKYSSNLGRTYNIYNEKVTKTKHENEGLSREEWVATTLKKCSLRPEA